MGFLLIAFLGSCVSLFHSVHGAGAGTGGETVRCTAGTFVVGDHAQIHCQFPIDVNASQHNFNIMHYKNETDSSGSYMILCNWVANSPQCSIPQEYALNLTSGKNITVEIPTVKDWMSGAYLCQLVPSDGVTAEKCSLTITQRNSSVPLSTISSLPLPLSITSPKAVTDQARISDTHTPSSGGNDTTIVSIFLAIFVIISIMFCVFVFYLRRRYILTKRTPANAEADAWSDFSCVKLKCLTLVDQTPIEPTPETQQNKVPNFASDNVNTTFLTSRHEDEEKATESDQETFEDALLPNDQHDKADSKALFPMELSPPKTDIGAILSEPVGPTKGGDSMVPTD